MWFSLVSSFIKDISGTLQETNVLGFKGPRKMTVILPGMTQEQQRVQICPQDESETLLGKMRQLFLSKIHWIKSILILGT